MDLAAADAAEFSFDEAAEAEPENKIRITREESDPLRMKITNVC